MRIICNLADFENKKNKLKSTFSEAGLPTYTTGKKNSIISVATFIPAINLSEPKTYGLFRAQKRENLNIKPEALELCPYKAITIAKIIVIQAKAISHPALEL